MKDVRRILLAKMGLDSHDTGIVTVAEVLRDAGWEVIYLGLHNHADSVARVAIDEDVDVIGVSFLSGQHMTQARRLIDAMRKQGLMIPVVCGGVIPDEDAAELLRMGVGDVIMPGTLSADVVRRVADVVATPIA